jgi:hypothetical protein
MLEYLRPFGLFYCHVVYFVIVLYILVISSVLVCCTKKIWQPWRELLLLESRWQKAKESPTLNSETCSCPSVYVIGEMSSGLFTWNLNLVSWRTASWCCTAHIHAVQHKFVSHDKIRTISIFCRPTQHALGKPIFSVGRHLSLPYGKLMPYGTSKNAVLCKQTLHQGDQMCLLKTAHF